MDDYHTKRLKPQKTDNYNLGFLQDFHFENVVENNLFSSRELEKRYKKAKLLLNKIIVAKRQYG